MLNITVQNSAEGAKKYFSRSDYYTKDSQELIGRWGGKGAVLLGLRGEVTQEAFERFCDNLNPFTGERLTGITREKRRVGYDFTWSAPKSISVVHALTGDERIADAFRESIRETMGELESESQTRVRRNDANVDRTTGNFVSAEFVHLTSRPVNGVVCPQLHAHVVAFNATYDPVEFKWKAGNFGKIKGDAYYWQAVQQTRFANKLQELGYSIRKTKDAFDIEGIPDSVLKKFSLRTNLIERVAAKLGITDPKIKAKLGATTREAKLDEIPYSKLVDQWKQQLSPEEGAAIKAARGSPITPACENQRHAEFAAGHMFERASVVNERRLLTLALRHGVGEVTPEGVRKEANKLGLLKREANGQVLVTTKEVLAEERRLIGYASQSRGTCRPLIGKEGISFSDTELDQQQRAAVELPLRTADRVTIIRGIAGTGKTRSVSELISQLQLREKEVVLVAPTHRAVGVLKQDGFEDAGTLASLLDNTEMQAGAKNGFIILDEAGMVGSRTMNELFDLAKQNNARVVLLGDKRQLPSVERGSPLRMLEDLAGLKVAEISEIRRQEGKYREAVKLLSKGHASEAFDKLDAMGCVKTMPVWEAYKPMAEDYANKLQNASEKDRDKEVLIVCPTHAEGNNVNEAVRKELKRRHLIGEDDRTFPRLVPLQWTQAERADPSRYIGDEVLQFHRNTGSFKAGARVGAADTLNKLSSLNTANFATFAPSTIELAKGDLIRATAKGKTLDSKHVLSNGSVYRVEGFDRGGNIHLTNGWTISKQFGHLAHAIANTAYAAQGQTFNHVLIVQSAMSFPASNRETAYVAVSRGRKSVTIYTDGKQALREAVQRSNPRVSAIELTAKPKVTPLRRMQNRMAKVQLAALVAAKSAAWLRPQREQEVSYAR